MEEVYEVFKHVCKLCTRSFPCGRSLGGHMRSHMINCASSASDHDRDQLVVEKDKLEFLKRKNNHDDHIGGYRVRENRKKTWRLVESSDAQGMILDALLSCGECGKVLHSSKAMFVHMKSDQSEKERVLSNTNNDDDDDNDNINNDVSLADHSCSCRRSQSENEESTVAPPLMNLPRISTRRRSRYNNMGNATNSSSLSFANNASSSVSEIDQLEQDEVALSLIMLSMDVGQWGGSSSTHNSTAAGSNTLFLDPEKRSIVGKGNSRAFSSEVEYTKMIMPSAAKAMKCESMDSEFFYYEGSEKFELSASGYLSNESEINKLEGSDHGYARYDQENGQKLKFGDGIEVQLSKGLRNNNVLFRGELDATKSDERKRKISEICNESDRLHLSKSASGSKRSRFEFGTCSKVFHSYQALGWQRASHKKIKGCSSSSLKHEIIDGSIETEPIGDGSLEGSKQGRKHECPICFKVFHSYQALGGHRASHKKIKGCSSSSLKHEIIDNSIETEPIGDGSLDGSKQGRKHECPICFKVFLSGQALGGHKRSHQITLSSDQAMTINQQSVVIQIPTPEIREFMDLNLPAPVEEEPTTAYDEFKSRWGEPLLSLI